MFRKDRNCMAGLMCATTLLLLSACTNPGPDNQDYRYTQPQLLDDGWEVSTLSQEGLDGQAITEMVDGVCAEYSFLYSILIARNGKLIFERYFNGADRDRLFSIQSSTKSVVSALIGIAIGAGNISGPGTPVHTLFPEWADLFTNGRDEITIEHLLMMTGGYEWDELSVPYDNPVNDNYRGNISSNYVEYALGQPLTDIPGSTWNYNSGGSNTLGEIIGRTTGMRVDEFAEQYLFSALGIDVTDWWVMRGGVVAAHGGLAMRARDMAKFGQLYLQGGLWKEQRIIPEAWVTESFQNQVPRDPGTSYNSNSRYGYQWWIDTFDGTEVYYACGYGGQLIVCIPEFSMVVVTAAETGGSVEIGQQHNLVLEIVINLILPSVLSR
ncbi:serine hydrolase domain-containing protein [Gemmatimonadota bacterium]